MKISYYKATLKAPKAITLSAEDLYKYLFGVDVDSTLGSLELNTEGVALFHDPEGESYYGTYTFNKASKQVEVTFENPF